MRIKLAILITVSVIVGAIAAGFFDGEKAAASVIDPGGTVQTPIVVHYPVVPKIPFTHRIPPRR